MRGKKVVSTAMALTLTASMVLGACGSNDQKAASGGAEGGSTSASDGTTEIEVYDVAANYQGMQTGWLGKIIEDKFGLTLNIFAPNTSGDAAALYQTRCSSGKLGDIILLDNLDYVDCIKAGLIKDISDQIWEYPNLAEYKEQIEDLNTMMTEDGAIYGIPTEMTNTSPESYSSDSVFSSPAMPWDYYQELGCPEVKDLDGLLDVLEEMQKAHPTNDAGDPAYAIGLWKDWDGFGMENVCQLTKWYGEEVNNSVLISNKNTMRPLTDKEGSYYKMLKFLFEANQRGLIDPDSSIQDWTTMDETKQRQKRVYLLWYNWQQSLANMGLTTEQNDNGEGFVNIPLGDADYYQTSDSYYGTGRVWGVGSQVDDATTKKILSLLDWLASPEGMTYQWAGIEGLTYEKTEEGGLKMTDNASDYIAGNAEIPEEYGGGGFSDGMSKLNQYIVANVSINPETKEPYTSGMWAAEKAKPQAKRYTDWSEQFKADNQVDYLQKNGGLTILPNLNVILESDSTDIALTRSQCGQKITECSWQMVFASSEEEFDQMWDSMTTELEGLGWEDLVKFDMAKYQTIIDKRTEVMGK